MQLHARLGLGLRLCMGYQAWTAWQPGSPAIAFINATPPDQSRKRKISPPC